MWRKTKPNLGCGWWLVREGVASASTSLVTSWFPSVAVLATQSNSSKRAAQASIAACMIWAVHRWIRALGKGALSWLGWFEFSLRATAGGGLWFPGYSGHRLLWLAQQVCSVAPGGVRSMCILSRAWRSKFFDSQVTTSHQVSITFEGLVHTFGPSCWHVLSAWHGQIIPTKSKTHTHTHIFVKTWTQNDTHAHNDTHQHTYPHPTSSYLLTYLLTYLPTDRPTDIHRYRDT